MDVESTNCSSCVGHLHTQVVLQLFSTVISFVSCGTPLRSRDDALGIAFQEGLDHGEGVGYVSAFFGMSCYCTRARDVCAIFGLHEALYCALCSI